MNVLVWGDDARVPSLQKAFPEAVFTKADDWGKWMAADGADLLINLADDALSQDYSDLTSPAFLHAVSGKNADRPLPGLAIRINGWAGFTERKVWECAGIISDRHRELAAQMGVELIQVPDEPGLIAGRVVAMIINEAYFALGESVSSKADIDTAMKLGTNYPYGPFEWANLIGPARVLELLTVLASTDARYTPSPQLIREATAP